MSPVLGLLAGWGLLITEEAVGSWICNWDVILLIAAGWLTDVCMCRPYPITVHPPFSRSSAMMIRSSSNGLWSHPQPPFCSLYLLLDGSTDPHQFGWLIGHRFLRQTDDSGILRRPSIPDWTNTICADPSIQSFFAQQVIPSTCQYVKIKRKESVLSLSNFNPISLIGLYHTIRRQGRNCFPPHPARSVMSQCHPSWLPLG